MTTTISFDLTSGYGEYLERRNIDPTSSRVTAILKFRHSRASEIIRLRSIPQVGQTLWLIPLERRASLAERGMWPLVADYKPHFIYHISKNLHLIPQLYIHQLERDDITWPEAQHGITQTRKETGYAY